MKEAVKDVSKAVSAKARTEAEKLLPLAYKALDKAVKRGVIKKNAAARKKSRLVRLIKKTA